MLPMLPAVLENCAEITYPISEEFSTGLLFTGQIFALLKLWSWKLILLLYVY